MLISESFMSKFSCHPLQIKAHSHLNQCTYSQENASYGGHNVWDYGRMDVHAARQRAWTGSKILCESYSAGSLVRVLMVISTISWQADCGGGGAAIARIGCACINAQKVEARSCGGRSTEEHRQGCGSAEEHRRVCGSVENR